MTDIVYWPAELLKPERATLSKVAFSRSGGRSLGGLSRSMKSDRGFWRINLSNVSVWTADARRTWNAISTDLGGTPGLVAVPAWSLDSAPYVGDPCQRPAPLLTPHDDETEFDDDTLYYQGSIALEMATYAPLGATVITLRAVHSEIPVGIRFSYQHALYETGSMLSHPGADTFQVSVFPAIRQAIPAGSMLEADRPTCLCHLSTDAGMDLEFSSGGHDAATVDFVEAVDYWDLLARGEVT